MYYVLENTVSAMSNVRLGAIFFTQRGSRKVKDSKYLNKVSFTLWLPLSLQSVIAEGQIEFLSEEENLRFWKELPRERQLKYYAYAPTSGLPIESEDIIIRKLEFLKNQYPKGPIPMSEEYTGLRLKPIYFYFYSLTTDPNHFSKSVRYSLEQNGSWKTEILSP
jgi:pyridoxamine 5'-phosphate oxidase